ncbi:MAG: diguanylate cyclase [Sphingomicrobium sp.]
MLRTAVPMPLRVGVIYFILATLAIRLVRYDGGVALLWFANAYLIAELSVIRRRKWPWPIAVGAFASILATGLFGLGWAASLPMAAANMVEVFVAAYLLRRHSRQAPLESLEWLGQFIVAAVVAAPMVSGTLAAITAAILGNPPLATYVKWISGHGLSNLTFVPLFLLFAQGEMRGGWRRVRDHGAPAVALIALCTATIALTFAQRSAPLLFLPILSVILITFRLGRGASVLAILALALIGGGATLAGYGPLHTMSATPGQKAQFFQFYLATTVLTVWPIVADLRNRARLLNALSSSEARYRLIADHSSDIMMKLDLQGMISYVSPSIGQFGEVDPHLLIGRSGLDMIPKRDRGRVRALYRQVMNQPDRALSFEYEAVIAGGAPRWFEAHSRAVIDGLGEVVGTMSIIRDVSARKANEQSLSEAALTDALTGLPNLRAFRQAVAARAASASTGSDCLALLDIDHFKRVNDIYGHPVGDLVLRNFAAAAIKAVREGDIVVRYGGEEFIVLFIDTPLDRALEICERLRARVANAVTMCDGEPIRVTVSGGVAQIGPEGLAEALKVADAALYRAKEGGRDRLAIAA